MPPSPALKREALISTDYSCLLHLDGWQKQKIKLKALHIADMLASGL